MNTDTPRTDAHLKAQVHTYSPSVDSNFARKLELENRELRRLLARACDLLPTGVWYEEGTPVDAVAKLREDVACIEDEGRKHE